MATTFETHYGLLSTADYVSTAHPRYTWWPESWDQSLLLMDPGGDASMTAIMSLGNTVAETSSRFHWGEQMFPDDYGVATEVYGSTTMTTTNVYSPTTAAPSGPLSGGLATAGSTLVFKMAAAQASKFVAGMVVATRDTSNPANTVRGVVGTPVINGASSYVPIVTLETDDNGDGAYGTVVYAADAADGLKIIGSVNAEGAEPPNPVGYMHQDKEGVCQIFRTSMKHSRTAKQTKLRTPNQVRKARRELNLVHQARKERSLFHGIMNASYTVGGEPARLAGGMDYYITSNVYNLTAAVTKANIDTLCAAMAAKKPQGMKSNRRLCFCGQAAYVAITGLIYATASTRTYNIETTPSSFGFEITTYKHPLITLDFMVHPLLTQDLAYTKSMYCVLPSLFENHVMQPDVYRPQVGTNGMDGEMSELLCEIGWAIKGEEMMGIMHNIYN